MEKVINSFQCCGGRGASASSKIDHSRHNGITSDDVTEVTAVVKPAYPIKVAEICR